MATRSNIAYKTAEGKIRSVYCHWDGYPAYNGEVLKRFYNSFDRAVALVELGSISALKEHLHSQSPGHDFENPIDEVSPNTNPIKDFSPVLPIAIINIPAVAIMIDIQTFSEIRSLRNKNAKRAVKKGIAAKQSKVTAALVFVIE